MLLKVFLLIFLVDFTFSNPQGDCTERPLPNRPFYQPNPSYQLISQIIPTGQPWPANAGDYATFSQTQRPPNYTPLWATSRPTTNPPSAPTIVNILRPTSAPVNLEDRFKETENPDYAWFWPEQKNEELVSTTQKSSTSMLFTSAPAVLNVRIDEDEPKLDNIKPVNLIPDKFMVTMKPPRGSGGSTTTKRIPVSATVKMPTRKPTPQQQQTDTIPNYGGFNSFFKK